MTYCSDCNNWINDDTRFRVLCNYCSSIHVPTEYPLLEYEAWLTNKYKK